RPPLGRVGGQRTPRGAGAALRAERAAEMQRPRNGRGEEQEERRDEPAPVGARPGVPVRDVPERGVRDEPARDDDEEEERERDAAADTDDPERRLRPAAWAAHPRRATAPARGL